MSPEEIELLGRWSPASPESFSGANGGALARGGWQASLALETEAPSGEWTRIGEAPLGCSSAPTLEHARLAQAGGQPGEARGASAAAAREPSAAADLGAARQGEHVQRAQDILRQIQLQFSAHSREAMIHLQPAELGRIAIRLQVRGGRIDTEMRIERDSTLADLQGSLSDLRSILERNGMGGGELKLALGFEQHTGGKQPPPRSTGQLAETLAPAGAPAAESAPLPPVLLRALASDLGIDTFA